MRTQHRHLNELFSEAKRESNFVTEDEIDQLLDTYDRHGRPFDGENVSTSNRINGTRRGLIMGILSTAIVGAVIGAGTFFMNINGEKITVTPSIAEQGAKEGATTESLAALNVPGFPGGLISGPTLTGPIRRGASSTEHPASLETPSINSALEKKNTTHQTSGLQEKNGNEPQDTDVDIESDEVDADELSRQIGTFVTDYWYDRINSYRQFIDRSLGTDDRAQLNRLRVRWELAEGDDGLFNVRMATSVRTNVDGNSISKSMNVDSDSDGEFMIMANIFSDMDSNVASPEEMFARIDAEEVQELLQKKGIEVDRDVEEEIEVIFEAQTTLDDEVDVEIDVDEKNGETREKTHVRKIQIRSGREEESRDEMAFDMGGFDGDGMAQMLKMAIMFDRSDRSTILQETWAIADRNRSKLDDLKEQVMTDVREFGRVLEVRLRDYAETQDGELAEKLNGALENHEEMTAPIFDEVLGPLYDVLAEPMLMLYNGSDITPVLSSGITEPVAGITLDGRSALAQSYPNPATTHATIDFRLDSPSDATVLRLYDVSGNEIARHDLGTRETGNHSYELDLSDVPNGTYLYHLTVGSSEGSRVWSRSLEVVR